MSHDETSNAAQEATDGRQAPSTAGMEAQGVPGAPGRSEGPPTASGGCRPVYCVAGPCADTCLRRDDPNPIAIPDARRQRIAARIREVREGQADADRPAIPLQRAADLYFGRSAPTVRELALYAEACGVTVDWLLTGVKEATGDRVSPQGPASGVRDVQADTDATDGLVAAREALPFDGCNSECRKAGKHTLRWGGCEYAPEPEPTVGLSCVYIDTDDQPSIGFDTYTVQQLADLITPALITPEDGFALPYDEDYGRALALDAAKAIFHRNDPAPDQT